MDTDDEKRFELVSSTPLPIGAYRHPIGGEIFLPFLGVSSWRPLRPWRRRFSAVASGGSGFGRWTRLRGADDFHPDFRREQGFEAALEAALDEVVERAAAAGADQDAAHAVHRRLLGQQFGAVRAGVVDGDD